MHRLTRRVENFGVLFAAAIFDLLAMNDSKTFAKASLCTTIHRYAAASDPSSFFRGIPIARRNSLASSSFRAEVTSVIFIP